MNFMDPRMASYGHTQFGLPTGHVSNEILYLLGRIDYLQTQLVALTDLVRRGTITSEQNLLPFTGNQVAQQRVFAGVTNAEVVPFRVRESDSRIFCDIFLPNLSIGDVEVDVNGNRLTCRTRVPVAPISRWITSNIQTRGLEIFELPDGRVEYSWVCPVAFTAREIEATFRDGYLTICVPKSETVQTRHLVKINKETSAPRRASGEMNS